MVILRPNVSTAMLLLLGTALLVGLLWSSHGADGATPRLPWSDDFDDGNLDGWTISKSGSGTITADSSQSVSPTYSMHVRSPKNIDSAVAELGLYVNNSVSYCVEFDFRAVGSNHWFELFRNHEMCVVLDSGSIVVQEQGPVTQNVMLTYANTWYHVKLLYNATNQTNTIWVNGLEKLTFGRDLEISTVRIGDTYWLTYYGEVFYDNFKVYYEDEPVARPPRWGELPTIAAVEDVPVAFDFTAYVSARDMDPTELNITADSPHVTGVVGRTVTFRFPNGVLAPTVQLMLNDGRLDAPADVNFTVEPVDDPPTLKEIPPALVTEGLVEDVDLGPYIEDIDTPMSALTLACTDPACVEVVGQRLKLLFTEWQDLPTVEFTVSDGNNTVAGIIAVEVTAVNDPPFIVGIGDLTPPYKIVLDEGREVWLRINIVDEDDTDFDITIVSLYVGISIANNGTIHIKADKGIVSNFTAELTVKDLGTAKCVTSLSVQVRNVNDPPGPIVVVSPNNLTTVEEGSSVVFKVEVTDPDAKYGQVLTVSWVSDIAGSLGTVSSPSELRLVTGNLSLGKHVITIYATDGQYTNSAWMEVTVVKKYVPPEPEEPPFYKDSTVIAAIVVGVIVAVLAVILAFAMSSHKRQKLAEAMAPPPPPPPPSGPAAGAVDASGKPIMQGDLARETSELSTSMDRLEAERRAEAVDLAPGTAELDMDVDMAAIAAPAITDEMARNERARELRDLRKGLMQLPTGLPKALEGRELSELANAILDGERRKTRTGSPLAKVDGVWYRVDLDDMNTFMKEWQEPKPAGAKGPKAATGTGTGTLAERLEQLEVRLITGEIDETTYNQLKKRYEQEG